MNKAQQWGGKGSITFIVLSMCIIYERGDVIWSGKKKCLSTKLMWYDIHLSCHGWWWCSRKCVFILKDDMPAELSNVMRRMSKKRGKWFLVDLHYKYLTYKIKMCLIMRMVKYNFLIIFQKKNLVWVHLKSLNFLINYSHP